VGLLRQKPDAFQSKQREGVEKKKKKLTKEID